MKAAHLIAPVARRLEGKVAVITGGASGIGESCVRSFIRHGAKVVIADVQDDQGLSICNDIGSDDNISYIHCDVRNDSDVRNVVDTTVSKYGKLDIMFNNAGIIGEFEPKIVDIDNEEFKRVFDVNVHGAFLGAKHAARVMIPAKKGNILFTASLSSVTAGLTSHAYSASKHAVVGLTKNLCAELGHYGIRVNCISPYGIITPQMIAMKMRELRQGKEAPNWFTKAKGPMMKGEDLAEASIFLASDESKYVNGLNLIVDGGFSTTNQAFSTGTEESKFVNSLKNLIADGGHSTTNQVFSAAMKS